jgi:PAS domain S-box-containing protein
VQTDLRDLDDEQLRRALDGLRDMFAVFDERNRLIYWNDHAQKRSGYAAEELAGMRPEQLVAEEDLPELQQYLEQVHLTGQGTVEVRLVAKGGEAVPHELYSDLLTDRDGTVVGRVVVGRDVSQRQAYQRILELKNDRLAAFARFVSHDVTNPLAVAGGRLELYRETGAEADYQEIVAAHRRIEQVVEDLLRLTSYGTRIDDASAVDPVAIAEEAWQTVRSDRATLRVDEVGHVAADRGLLRQALKNLLRNAVQHGGEGVTVRVGPLTDDTGFFVEDDGPGFPPECESPFEPGVTTQPGGTGLGLAIVAEVAAVHGWSVEATTAAAGGARIEFGGVDRAVGG